MYSISYAGLSETEADVKALHDIKFWLGDQFDSMDKMLRDGVQTGEIDGIKTLRLCCSFVGIKGFLVETLARRYKLPVV